MPSVNTYMCRSIDLEKKCFRKMTVYTMEESYITGIDYTASDGSTGFVGFDDGRKQKYPEPEWDFGENGCAVGFEASFMPSNPWVLNMLTVQVDTDATLLPLPEFSEQVATGTSISGNVQYYVPAVPDRYISSMVWCPGMQDGTLGVQFGFTSSLTGE